MKEDTTSYLIAIIIVFMAAGAAWLILHLASPNTASSVTGNEASYSQLQQSILKP